MADNVTLDSGTGGADVAADELTYSGDTAVVALSRSVHVTGSEGSKTLHEIVFAEDAAAPSTIYGHAIVMERDDALASLTPVEGDWASFRCSAEGALWTQDFNSDAILAAAAAVQAAVEGTLTVGSHAVTNAGTFVVQEDGAALTALQLIDNIVSGSGANISQLGGASVPIGAGLEATAVRVTLPTDGTGIVGLSAVDNAVLDNIDTNTTGLAGTVSGSELQVDVVASLPTGSNTIGAVNLSATDNAVLDQIEVNTSYGDSVGGGTEAAALRVTLANDSTGVVSVDDGGGSLTVDGTVTANLSATDNAVLDNIDTQTTAAASLYRNIDANAEAAIKGSAGVLHWLHVINATAAKAYLHLYDATTATVNPGTTTPGLTFAIPTSGDTNGAGFNLPLGPNGQDFATAITMVCTTTLDGSAGDPGTNGVIVNGGYT